MKEGWEYKKLGEICDSITGLWIGKKTPFVNVGVIRNTNFTKDCKLDMSNVAYLDVEESAFNKKKLIKGDLIIEKSGGSDKQPVGRSVLFNAEGNFSFSNFTGVLRIQNKDIMKPQFLQRYLSWFYKIGGTFNLQSKTTGLHNLDFTKYKNILIPVPSLPMQQQIVSHLDKLNEILDKLRETLNVLNKAEQALFYDMFGDPVENQKGWEIKKVKDIATVVGGSTPKTNVEEYWNGDLNWITPVELVGSMYLNDSVRKITNKAVQKTNLTLLPVGTVILSSRAPIGKIAISNIPTYCNQGFKNIICSSYISNIYVYAYLKCRVDYLISLGRGATFKEISKTIVENIPIHLPPLSLQQTFAARITTIEIQKQKLTTSIAKFQEMLDSAMASYFDD